MILSAIHRICCIANLAVGNTAGAYPVGEAFRRVLEQLRRDREAGPSQSVINKWDIILVLLITVVISCAGIAWIEDTWPPLLSPFGRQ